MKNLLRVHFYFINKNKNASTKGIRIMDMVKLYTEGYLYIILFVLQYIVCTFLPGSYKMRVPIYYLLHASAVNKDLIRLKTMKRISIYYIL